MKHNNDPPHWHLTIFQAWPWCDALGMPRHVNGF